MATFLSFPFSTLQPGDTTHFDVFLTEQLQIYALAGHTWTKANLDFLTADSAPLKLYYLSRDEREVTLFLAKKKIAGMTGGAIDKTTSIIVKVLEGIRTAGVISADAKVAVEASAEVIIDRLIADPRHALMLGELKVHDDYTHQHNARVGVYSVGLAIQMGVTNRDVLRSVALGGTLHDIGKLRVPLDILNKPGKLTADEFAVIKSHPAIGAELVKAHYADNAIVVDMVEKHHEKINGHGYPRALTSLEIPPYVRIAAVADVFDALTTARSYHKARTPYEALAFMQENMGDELDREVYQAMVLLQAGKPKTA